MARRLLIAFVLALLPVVAVVVHPELRQVMRQDVALLLPAKVDIFALPNDSPEREAILRLENLRGEEGTWQRVEEYARMARETGKPYLYAAAIREATRWNLYPKNAPIEPPPGVKEIPKLLPEWEEKRQYMAQRVLSISNEMIAVDRDNAFPYLAKMCALFVLGQDEAALDALRTAAACPQYLEYDLAWVRVLAPRSLITEARLFIMASTVYPYLAQFRESMRYVRLLADRLKQKGEHTRALALREEIASVGTKMRDSQGVLVSALVGVSLQEIAWSGEHKTTPSEREDAVHRIMTTASEFATYARKYGRADLAETALREASCSQALKRKAVEFVQQTNIVEPPWITPYAEVLSLRAAGVILLLWTFGMAFCLGLSLIFSPLWKHPPAQQDHLAPVTSALIAAGAFVAVAVAGFFALDGFGTLWQQWLQGEMTDEGSLPLPAREHLIMLHGSAVAVMSLLAALCFAPALVRVSRAVNRSWIAWLVAFGILLGLSIASTEIVQGYAAITGYDAVLSVLGIAAMIGGLAGLVASPFYAFLVRKPLPVPFRAGIAALWGLMSIVAWTGFLTETALWLAVGLVLWLIWGRSLPEDARLETQRAVYRFGMSALILAVLGLWLYAILGYVSLPARAQQHAYLDQLIEHGEMSLLQQFSK